MSEEQILQFKKANCRNCYKCVRNCPVKAIEIREHQARIIEKQCILCERCTLVCPQNAKQETSHIAAVKSVIRERRNVIAVVHRAYIAYYGDRSFASLRQALQQLGFSKVIGSGAGFGDALTQYRQLVQERMDPESAVRTYSMRADQKKKGVDDGAGDPDGRDRKRRVDPSVLITSFCPVVVRLVEKKYPQMVPNLAPVLSPVQLAARRIKMEDPDAVIVSINPCISKMVEQMEPVHYTDYEVTFRQLDGWLSQEKIKVKNSGDEPVGFGPDGSSSLINGLGELAQLPEGAEAIRMDGMDSCRSVLDEIEKGGYHDCLIELSACHGGCIGGPSFGPQPTVLRGMLRVRQAIRDTQAVMREKGITGSADSVEAAEELPIRIFASRPDTSMPMPEESEIRRILHAMGKDKPEDELNCSACGYGTCREKAIAVAQKKAEIQMCVPFMLSRSQNFAGKIINAMPGLLVTTDYSMKIVHMNRAALEMFPSKTAGSLIGSQVSELMDDYSIVNMIAFDKGIVQDQVMLDGGKRILDRVLTNDRKNELILCVMKDVTKETKEREQMIRSRNEAARMADMLVEEQMKMVHQIAGLLGETAADTKVAVERLKRTIQENKEDRTFRPEGYAEDEDR